MSVSHWAERLFAAALDLLPRSVRDADGESILVTYREQLDDTRPGLSRVRVAGRGLVRLLGVIGAEWLEELGWSSGPIPGRELEQRRGGMGWMRNTRLAVRSLRRAPSFTLTTVVLVGLGVGTVTTVFTVVDDVLLRPLPYPAADRLTYLTNGSHNGLTLRRLDGVEAFDLWTATSGSSVILTRPGADPAQLRRVETTPAFFTMFGAQPSLGRLLVDDDRDHLDRVVLTHAAWSGIWGADPTIVGKTVQIDGRGVEVVGVLSSDFVIPAMLVGDPVHMFRPLDWSNPGLDNTGYHAHSVAARLAAGVSITAADAQMANVARAVAASDPEYYADGPPQWPLQSLHDRTVVDVRQGLTLLLGAVALLLLVACANVAHLFMARGLSRGREVAIRRALGARSGNILAGLAAESLAVGLAGGLVGLVLAALTLSGVRTAIDELPRGTTIDLDPGVFAFAVGLATVTALLFGMVPAMRTLGGDVQTTLRGAGRGVSGGRHVEFMRSALVIGEVALSLVLVTSAGLLMRSFMTVTARDPGIRAESLYVVPLAPQNVESADRYRQRLDAVRMALQGVPGVESVTYGIEAPFEFTGGEGCCWSNRMTLEGDEGGSPLRVTLHPASPDYFRTYGTEVAAGRAWDEDDADGSPTPLVLSEALAVRRFGAAEAALGQSMTEPMEGTVVGVAEATLHYGLDQPHDYAVYMPIEALPFPIDRAVVALRVRDAGSAGLGRAVREAIWSVEPDLPVPAVVPMSEWITGSSAARRFASLLLSAFGTVALLLAAAGLYGTLLYAVGQQRKELGIRMALGADRRSIHTRVLRRGFTLAVAGVTLGALIAWGLGRLLESFLYGVSATDPIAMTGSAFALLATAVVASWLPALRAGRTDPLETLRAE